MDRQPGGPQSSDTFDPSQYFSPETQELPAGDRAKNELKSANATKEGFMVKPDDAINIDFLWGLIDSIDGDPEGVVSELKNEIRRIENAQSNGIKIDSNPTVWQHLNTLSKPRKQAN